MRRIDVALVMLATANGGDFTPVQIQKAMFLLDREAGHIFTESRYYFRAYDYGPFDKAVYDDLEELARHGYAEIEQGWTRRYSAKARGVTEGRRLGQTLAPEDYNFIQSVSEFVRSQSFSDLVSSIYRAYPEMRANSIFVS